MVVTTQDNQVFLANGKTSCSIRTDTSAKPEHKKTTDGGILNNFLEYYRRTDNPAHVLWCGNIPLGKYADLDRAKEVRSEFNSARDDGADQFTFPEK